VRHRSHNCHCSTVGALHARPVRAQSRRQWRAPLASEDVGWAIWGFEAMDGNPGGDGAGGGNRRAAQNGWGGDDPKPKACIKLAGAFL
jgi:hypothetical protein